MKYSYLGLSIHVRGDPYEKMSNIYATIEKIYLFLWILFLFNEIAAQKSIYHQQCLFFTFVPGPSGLWVGCKSRAQSTLSLIWGRMILLRIWASTTVQVVRFPVFPKFTIEHHILKLLLRLLHYSSISYYCTE